MGVANWGLSPIIPSERAQSWLTRWPAQSLSNLVPILVMKPLVSAARRNFSRLLGRPTATFVLFAACAWILSVRAADAPAGDFKTIDRANFTLKYPTAWAEDTTAPDYKADSNFTIKSPDPKNTYVQFNIVDKSEDPEKVLKATMVSLDGPAITALSKDKITEWGQFKGSGMHLKGKILDSIPGGIKVFIFNSDHHNILVVEYYFSEELKDLQADLDYISQNFVMKN
jgi:hypothetical protein